jgi:hypothetical protein
VLLEVISGPPPTLENPDAWSDGFKEFIALCLTKEPRKRKSATELLKVYTPLYALSLTLILTCAPQHPWIGIAGPKSELVAAIEARKRHEASMASNEASDHLIDADEDNSSTPAPATTTAEEEPAPLPAEPSVAAASLPLPASTSAALPVPVCVFSSILSFSFLPFQSFGILYVFSALLLPRLSVCD